MKVATLITVLKTLPQNLEVGIFDSRKNLHHASDEPSGIGIETDFSVNLEKENVNEPFVSLQFENDDYEEDGSPSLGASILNCKKS